MTFGRAWLVLVAEAVSFAIFFFCALKARDLYIEIANVYELGGGEDRQLSFVEWHVYAREAFLALMALWLIAIVIATYQFIRSLRSQTQTLPYRPSQLLAASLALPAAGILLGFVFDLFLPGL
jgi:hypothetical protein